MPSASELRRRARAGISGNWLIAIAVTFVAALLGGTGYDIRLPDFIYETKLFENDIIGPWVTLWSEGVGNFLIQKLMPWLALKGLGISIASLLFYVFIGGAVTVGLCRYYTLLIADKEQQPFATLFAPFRYVGRTAALSFFTALFTLLWALLLVIPGIIATYRYAMAPYILAQEPDISAMEAIERSKEMMRGHKFRLFCLHISFIGWMLLSALTLGVAGLWVTPYRCAAQAAFYLDLAQPEL